MRSSGHQKLATLPINDPERKRVSLAGFEVISVGIDTDRSNVGAGGTQVRVMMKVGHDATGHRVGPLHITAASQARLGPRLDAEELRALAKEAIMNCLSHEVDEWLRVDGLRAEVEHAAAPPPDPPPMPQQPPPLPQSRLAFVLHRTKDVLAYLRGPVARS